MKTYSNLLRVTHYFEKYSLSLEVFESNIFSIFKEAFIKKVSFAASEAQKRFRVIKKTINPGYQYLILN